MRIADGREVRGWRRGAGGGLILMVLIGVALVLLLMFGGFGGKSYMQNVAGAKKKGETLNIDVVAYSLVQSITAVRASDPDAAPKTFEELGVPPSAFQDPWGQPIRWEFDDDRRPTNVTVISDGPDGQAGTEDDIRVEKRLSL